MKKKYKLAGSIMTGVMLVTVLTTGCAKDVECYIGEEHAHLYINPDSGLSKYIDSEKDHVGKFLRSDKYLNMTEELRLVSENELFLISDNQEYFNDLAKNKKLNKREAYVYDYVYGSYYGYGYGYNPVTGNPEYFYGQHAGYHYGYEWQEIPLDTYTDDKVRDITYKIRVYKIENGNTKSAEFDTLEDITDDYKYFKNDIIIEHTSDSYYLENNNVKSR